MRSISAPLATELAKTHGVEPLITVEIQWTEGGNNHVYCDKTTAFANGKILDMSPLDFVININDGSDSAEISLSLDDTDNTLKTIMDTQDIHKKRVWIYQYVVGTTYATDKALMFSGEINSPIVWNEGDRTIKFSVISKIEDAEIGFSIEEGQFPDPPSELIGVPWPLKFGTTIRVPALRLQSPARGVLSTGVGISDFTLDFRISAAQDIICPSTFRGWKAEYNIFNSILLSPVFVTDEGCALDRCFKVTTLQTQRTEQLKFEYTKITIIDGERFPQNTLITLDIDGGKFIGTFDGNIFTIEDRIHPDFDELGGVPTTASVNAILSDRISDGISSGCTGLSGGFFADGTPTDAPDADLTRRLVAESESSIAFFNAIPTADFFWANPGSTVTLDTGEEIVYVSNILPEEVLAVMAYRNFDAGKKLVTVPPSYYTTRETDYNSYTMTEIVLTKALSQYDESWEDDLYVNSISTVGPNTVDIMEWLITKYTDIGIDSTSFDYVKTRLAVYPSDFPILERKNVLNVLQEIAFQCRCSIYIRDNTFYLKYLSELPPAISTIDESDIDSNSLEIFHTDTENLVTKLVAEWQRDYSKTKPNKIVLRHNIEKYGTQEETFNFYIYNELDYVHKSATFWIIRKANTWRQLRFSTPIHKLILESFDGVDLTVDAFSPNTIRGLITKSDYNTDTQSLDFEIWTPVKSGTLIQYDFAHPADIAEELYWPTDAEISANLVGSGTAPGFTTFAPVGHPLEYRTGIQGVQFGPCESQGLFTHDFAHQTCGGGSGDTYPSDTGDTIKEKTPESGAAPLSPIDPGEINVGANSDGSYFTNSNEAELRQRLAYLEQRLANAQSTANSANEAAGGDGSSTQNEAPDPFESLPDPDDVTSGCDHRVSIFLSEAVVLTNGSTGAFGADRPVAIHTIRFAYRCEALEVVQKVQALHASRQAAQSYTTAGGPYPVNATVILDSAPECLSGTPPTSSPPVPVGYKATATGTPTLPTNSPSDYWDDLGLVDGCA